MIVDKTLLLIYNIVNQLIEFKKNYTDIKKKNNHIEKKRILLTVIQFKNKQGDFFSPPIIE